MKRNHWIKHIRDGIFILFIAIALLAAAEVTLRLIYPQKVFSSIIDTNLAFEFHPVYLVKLKPNISKTYNDEITWSVNNDGFRGEALRDDAHYRIMVYGDSNIQARFTHLEETFPARLQSYFSSNGQDMEVINSGVVGFGPDQSVLKIEDEIDTYEPDIVVLQIFCDNDYGDLIRNRIFDLENGQLTLTRDERTTDVLLSGRKTVKQMASSLLITRAALQAMRLGTDMVSEPTKKEVATLIATNNAEFAVYEDKLPQSFSQFADHYDIDIAIDPKSLSATTKVALMEQILLRAQALADSKNVKLLILIQPASTDLTTNMLLNHEYLSQYPEYDRKRMTSSLEEICSRNSLNCLNLYDVFMEGDPETFYFRGSNNHWNSAGQDRAARATYDYMNTHFPLHEPGLK